jgi:hypothetical protein
VSAGAAADTRSSTPVGGSSSKDGAGTSSGSEDTWVMDSTVVSSIDGGEALLFQFDVLSSGDAASFDEAMAEEEPAGAASSGSGSSTKDTAATGSSGSKDAAAADSGGARHTAAAGSGSSKDAAGADSGGARHTAAAGSGSSKDAAGADSSGTRHTAAAGSGSSKDAAGADSSGTRHTAAAGSSGSTRHTAAAASAAGSGSEDTWVIQDTVVSSMDGGETLLFQFDVLSSGDAASFGEAMEEPVGAVSSPVPGSLGAAATAGGRHAGTLSVALCLRAGRSLVAGRQLHEL